MYIYEYKYMLMHRQCTSLNHYTYLEYMARRLRTARHAIAQHVHGRHNFEMTFTYTSHMLL
jgi:hypothetical protein